MGTAVLEVLAGAYDNYAARLHFRPDDPITVVLEMGNSFQDTGAPEWAAGFNDGVIHVPLRGMERLSVGGLHAYVAEGTAFMPTVDSDRVSISRKIDQ